MRGVGTAPRGVRAAPPTRVRHGQFGVGTILSVSLLTIPAMTARLVTRRVATGMIASAAIGALAGVVGLTISAQWRVAAGAAITLTAAGLFLIVFAATALVRRPGSVEQVVLFADAGRAPEPAL